MHRSRDLEAYDRREAEILARLAKRREETSSALVRSLVLQTIGEVEQRIVERPDTSVTAEEPRPPIR